MRTIRISLGELKALIREELKIKSRMPSKDSYEDGEQRDELPDIKKESEELE